jgi:guanylate cyclase
MTLLLGGLLHSNGQIVWALIAPVGMLIILGPRSALVFFLLFVLAILGCLVAQPYLRQGNNLPLSLKLSFFASNVILMASYVVLLMYFFIARNAELFRLLEAEQKRSEELLLNILPHKIAAVLKHEPRTIADYHEGVSILFADVVDFTPISAELAAEELVELLNEVFSGFDELAEKHGLEKIKTIGDCYMAAAGIPQAREDHALALVRMALEMQRLAREHAFRGKRLVFRIGINSGSVVAGVIGRRKFIYDLWGDAVNTASRMESHGRGGFIQITRSTYELIKDQFECVPQGKILVKGKGEMEVWHVLREKGADGALDGREECSTAGA